MHQFFLLLLLFRLKQIKQVTSDLEAKLKETAEAKLSADEISAQVEKLLQEEERNQTAMSAELAQLRDLCFKKSQKSHDLSIQLKNIDADIQVMRLICFNFNIYSWCRLI